MPPIKTDAFILKRIDFRETSVILTLFTKEIGKIKGVLKGVRSPKSKIPPLTFSEGSHINIFVYKKKTGLNLFSSPVLIDFLNFEKKREFRVFLWILKLIDLFVPENQIEENIFSLIFTAKEVLKYTRKPWLIFLGFKIKFIEILGYGIKTDRCSKCDKNKKILFFSPKIGGVLCKECSKKEFDCIKISGKINSIIKFIKKVDLKNIEVLRIKKSDCEKINFLCNLTLYYHTSFDFIWWENEKYIFRKDY
jgi:DNA repair protein RecO (recombination protein O)